MYNKIINFLKERPVLYAESDDAFWDDEHMQRVSFLDDVQGKEYTGLENTICSVFCK